MALQRYFLLQPLALTAVFNIPVSTSATFWIFPDSVESRSSASVRSRSGERYCMKQKAAMR